MRILIPAVATRRCSPLKGMLRFVCWFWLIAVFAGSALASNTWSAAGALAAARNMHTATLLPNGRVLVAGGVYYGVALASAELYDPASNTWSAAGSLTKERWEHTAMLLPNGKVLVAGGYSNNVGLLASAELYDPASNTWSAAGSLAAVRYGPTATLLPDGRVLVAGGSNNVGLLASAELYDPASNTWSAAGSLTGMRYGHTATLLPDGKVLVAGGRDGTNYLASAEMYDPASNTWSAAGALATARGFYSATLLPNGRVLVAGGGNDGGYPVSAELYDPASNTWSAAGSMATARSSHTATLLPSGKVLVAGGGYSGGNFASTELYDLASNTWSAAGSLATERWEHTATLLSDGKVLVAGGSNPVDYVAGAELFAENTPSDTVAPTTTANASPAPNAAGWNNSDVTISFAATDNQGGSGVRNISFTIVNGSNFSGSTVTGAAASTSISAAGVNTITYYATDNVGNVAASTTFVVRIDKTAPTGSLTVSPSKLWPANHKFTSIATTLNSADAGGGPVTVSGPVVTSNEPVLSKSDKTTPDWIVSGDSLQLRAERSNQGSGRVYTISYVLTDQAGNTANVSATVTVP